jgi:hypothetical protein
MTRLFLTLSLAFTLAACGDNTAPLLPPCPPGTAFAVCADGNTTASTGQVTCWKGSDLSAVVVGCAIPANDVEECVAMCGE